VIGSYVIRCGEGPQAGTFQGEFAHSYHGAHADGLMHCVLPFSLSQPGYLAREVTARFARLPLPADAVMLEYIWLAGDATVGDPSRTLKSKMRVVRAEPQRLEDIGTWIYDGTATEQAPGEDTEVVLRPVHFCPDPFRGAPHKLVLCDGLKQDGTPIASNTRSECARLLALRPEEQPWAGESLRAACNGVRGNTADPVARDEGHHLHVPSAATLICPPTGSRRCRARVYAV
jgi:hypothetical protein